MQTLDIIWRFHGKTVISRNNIHVKDTFIKIILNVFERKIIHTRYLICQRIFPLLATFQQVKSGPNFAVHQLYRISVYSGSARYVTRSLLLDERLLSYFVRNKNARVREAGRKGRLSSFGESAVCQKRKKNNPISTVSRGGNILTFIRREKYF